MTVAIVKIGPSHVDWRRYERAGGRKINDKQEHVFIVHNVDSTQCFSHDDAQPVLDWIEDHGWSRTGDIDVVYTTTAAGIYRILLRFRPGNDGKAKLFASAIPALVGDVMEEVDDSEPIN